MAQDSEKSYASLQRLSFILQQSSEDNLLKEIKIGLSHARIMAELNSSGIVSQRNLAKRLRQTEANISRQIRLMQRDGLVNIAKNPKDGRERQLSLTAKGAQLSEAADKILNSNYKNLTRHLDKNEAEVFSGAVSKLLNALS
jgi:DNA-binding MarR family transcriptional regulator